METTAAPFDLNQSIQQWRESLAQSPAFCRENLEELEMHLRDSIANLMQRGLAADEAFLIAVRRVGSGRVLGTEFGKINAPGIWLDRALWMLLGLVAFEFMFSMVSIFTLGFAALGTMAFGDAPSRSWWAGSVYALVHLSFFALVLTAGWRLLSQKGNAIIAWLRRTPGSPPRITTLVVAGILLSLFQRIVPVAGRVMVLKYTLPAAPGRFFLGLNYATIFSGAIESAALITLILLLARRQLFAKT